MKNMEDRGEVNIGEVNKMKKSIKSGMSTDEIYQPSFHPLPFSFEFKLVPAILRYFGASLPNLTFSNLALNSWHTAVHYNLT